MAITLDANLGTTASTTGAATTITQTTIAAAASGTRIVVTAGQFGTDVSSSVSDNSGLGLTWVKDSDFINGTDNVRFHVYSAYAPAGLPSGTVITHTWATAADLRTIAVSSFLGVESGASGYLTGTPAQAHEYGTTNWQTGNITPGAGEVLLFAGVAADVSVLNNTSVTAPATEINSVFHATTTQELTTAYRVVTADGSTAYSVAGLFGTAPGEQEYGVLAYEATSGPPPAQVMAMRDDMEPARIGPF